MDEKEKQEKKRDEKYSSEEERKDEAQPQDSKRTKDLKNLKKKRKTDSSSEISDQSEKHPKKKIKADPDSSDEPPKKKKAKKAPVESSSEDEKRSKAKQKKRKARSSSQSSSDEPPVKKSKKKRARSSSSSEDSQVKKSKKSKKKKKRKVSSSSDSSSESSEPPAKKKKHKKRAPSSSSSESDERPAKKSKKKCKVSSSSSSSDEVPVKKKKGKKRRARSSSSSEEVRKKKSKKKRKARSSSSDSSYEPVKKSKKKKRRKASSSSESSELTPRKPKKGRKRRVSSCSSSDEPPKKKSSKAKKKKYRRSPSSSSEEAPKKRKKKRRKQSSSSSSSYEKKKKSKQKKRMPSSSSSSSSSKSESSKSSQEGNSDLMARLRKILVNLRHKVEINDFMTLDYQFDRSAALGQIREDWANHKSINSTVLTSLLLYQVKNKASFQAILDDLDLEDDKGDFCLSPAVMFSYLLENSDTNLQTFLFNACSQYMPIPIYGRRYFSGNPDQFEVWQPSICVYEKYLSVLVLNFENLKKKSPIQTTEMINKILGKEFYVSEFEAIDHGSYQLQFDRNCSDPKFSVVILKIGPASPADLQSAVISKAFDFIFINYLCDSDKDFDHLKSLVNRAIGVGEETKIYSLVQTNLKHLSGLKEENRARYRFSKPYQMLGKKVDKLCISCWSDLKEDYFDKESSVYETSFKERWASKNSLISFLKDRQLMRPQAVRDLHCELEDIQEFVEQIIECDGEIKGPEMLPMNYYHNRMTKKTLKMKEGVGVHSHQKIEALEKKIGGFQEQISRCQATNLVCSYTNLLQKSGLLLKHQLMVTSMLSGLYQLKIAPIRLKWKRAEEIKDHKERALTEKKLKKEEIKEMFSLELLPRELYFLSRYSNRIFQSTFAEYVSTQIQSAQPIELIDGDNLLITDISQAIDQLCKNYIGPEDKITVVSIVGPQSSGKSLLLKFLFGTQFFSSEGRCTKGVYFSLLKMKVDEDKNEFILLLDTEGIQSSEGRDSTFDSRIIFFIMCVSNIVLICNKQEINAPMMNTLNLVIDNWVNARAEVSSSPAIFVVMNKLTGLNQKLIDNSEREIKKNLDLESKLDDDHKLGAFEVFGIPTFFQGQDFGPNLDQLRPVSKEFLQYIQILRKAITDQCLSNPSKETLPAWFHRTRQLWQTTEDFTGIHQYTSLAEKNEDQSLIEKVNEIVQKHLVHQPGSECFREIEQSLRRILEGERVGTEAIFNKLEAEVKKLFVKYRNKAEEEFDEYTASQKMTFTKKLTEKRKTTIEHHSKSQENKVFLHFKREAMVDVIAKSEKYGIDEMHDEVQVIVQGNRNLERNEAVRIAEKLFQKTIHQMHKQTQVKNCYEEINEFIREEFNRIKPELERSNKGLEKDGRKELLSQGLLGLRRFFITVFKQSNPLSKIGQMVPTREVLLKLSKKNSPFLKVPDSLFIMEKQVISFNKGSIVQMLQQALFYSEKGSLNIVYELYKARKDLKEIGEVLRVFNQEIYRINLKYLPDAMEVQAMTIELGRRKSFEDFSTSFMTSVSNPNSYTLADPRSFPNVQGRARIKGGPFFVSLKHDQAIQILQQCSTVQSDYYENVDQVEENQAFNCTVNPKASNLDSGLLEFLKALCGKRDINNLKSGQAQKAIEFSRLEEVFKKIEVIVCKQILNQSSRENSSSGVIALLNSALRDLQMPSDIEQDITGAINEASKVRSRADKNGICEIVLSNISGKVIDVMDDEYREINLKLSSAGVSTLVTYAQVIMARIWELKEMVDERLPIHNILQQKENAIEHAVARLSCNDKKIDETSARIIVSAVTRSIEDEAKKIAANSFKSKIDKFITDHSKKDVFAQIEREAYSLAKTVSGRYDQEMKDSEEADSEYMVDFYMDPAEVLDNRAMSKFEETSDELLGQTKEQYLQFIQSNANSFKVFMEDFLARLERNQCNKGAVEIFSLQDNSNVKDVSVARRGLGTYFKQYTSKSFGSGDSVQVKTNKGWIYLKQKQTLPYTNDQSLHSKIISGISSVITNSSEISNLATFAEEAIIQIRQYQYRGYPELSDDLIQKDSLNKLQTEYSGCTNCCPMCKRQCDQNHPYSQSHDERQHNCETGHQMSCFGGWRWTFTNRAVTETCEEYKDDQIIIINDERIPFSQFKDKHRQWAFSSPDTSLKGENLKKGILIWNYVVGRRIARRGDFSFVKAEEK